MKPVKRLLARTRSALTGGHGKRGAPPASGPERTGNEAPQTPKTSDTVPAPEPPPSTASPVESARFEPLDPAFVQDPYPTLAILRERDPVHRSPLGVFVLTRYEDVLAALSDPRLGNSPSPYAVVHARNRHRSVAADVANNILPFQDEPRHGEPRRLISRAFRAELRERPPEIEAMARRLLEERVRDGELEVLSNFATPLSAAILCRVLGVPEEDEDLLRGWSEWFFYLFSVIPSEEIRRRLDQALVEFRDYFARLIEQRRRAPGPDLISRLLAVRSDAGGLSRPTLIDTCMLLFSDGVENVDSAIANAVLALIEHPDQLELLRRDPSVLSGAVEECLRFQSPAQFIGRVALEDLVLHDVRIPVHSGVLLVLGSANRDPTHFDRADRLDIRRAPNTHLSFGKGRHACIGGPLVRLVMRAALATLLEAGPKLRLLEPEIRWQARLGHRWLESLRIGLGRRMSRGARTALQYGVGIAGCVLG